MTVAELRKALANYPDNVPVHLINEDSDFIDLEHAKFTSERSTDLTSFTLREV